VDDDDRVLAQAASHHRGVPGCWFHTGDLGYLDVDGYLFYVDRKKDAVRRKGEMVSSWEVETAVGRFPAVEECAMVAVPSEMGEDEIMVVVVPRDGAAFDPAELINFAATAFRSFKYPAMYEPSPTCLGPPPPGSRSINSAARE